MTVEAGQRRLGSDARRQQILAVAVRLFAERGYADVSTTDVARTAGVARGLINHYFGTKKDLYLAVVRVMLTVPGDAVGRLPGGDLAARVDALVGWFLDVVSRHSTSWLAAITAGGMADPDVDRVIDRAIDDAAAGVLAVTGHHGPADHAMARSYVWFATSTAREWLARGELTRPQVHQLLRTALIALASGCFGQL